MDGHHKADIKLDKLLVNPENYRFDPVVNQQEAIQTMLRAQKDKILNLARDIAQRGLNPMERLIIKEVGGGKYIVLEGNRRIIALKLMTNPNELSDDYPYKGVFEELHDKYKAILPTAVECVIYRADQQDSADSWIQLKHTGENQGIGTVAWNSVQRQRFASRHAEQEPKTLQILEFLKENGIDISRINLTNLERLLGTRGIPQMLGIDFPRKQKFILTEPQERVLQKLGKIVERMSADGFAVGQIYNAPQRVQWIQNVLAALPTAPTTSVGTSTPTPASSNGNSNTPAPQPAPSLWPDAGAGTQQPPTAGAGTSAPVPTAPTPAPTSTPTTPPAGQPAPASASNYSTLVNPANMLPAAIPDKIVSIYKELQIVNLTGKYAAPHAVAALLRILLEITAQEYLIRRQGFRIDSAGDFRNPAEQGKVYNRLDEKLKFIANSRQLPGHVANALRVLVSAQLITTTLNQVMHNTIFMATSTALKDLWQNFENVFNYLIGEIQ